MPTLRDDTGEQPAVAGDVGGFRQAFELWVCHAQLPAVELTERERQVLATRPLAELPGLRPRVDRLRQLSHLTWHWAAAPPERQFTGDRYERLEARLTVTDGVWLRPAHRVAGWVRDDGGDGYVPVDVIGFYATSAAYRGERWRFATGDTPDLARQGIDKVLEAEVDAWRQVVATVDAAQAALTVELPRASRQREPEDGWIHPPLPEHSPAAWVGPVVPADPPTELLDAIELGAGPGAVERVEPARGQAVVAWRAEPERAGWRRLLDHTRARVTAWVSRLDWRRQG